MFKASREIVVYFAPLFCVLRTFCKTKFYLGLLKEKLLPTGFTNDLRP